MVKDILWSVEVTYPDGLRQGHNIGHFDLLLTPESVLQELGDNLAAFLIQCLPWSRNHS